MAARDRSAVVWTRLATQPLKMGRLVVTDSEARFTYEDAYRDSGLRGLGLVYPPAAFSGTIVRPRSEYFDLHPPLQALLPQRSADNFQRNLVLRYLARRGQQPAPGFDTDWHILMHAGHGGIGHLDVFADDAIARQWYSTPAGNEPVQADARFGFSLKEFMTWYDEDAAETINLIGPTPTLGGAIPKIPLSISRDGWDGRIGLPTRYGDVDRIDIILKLEKSTAYPGIVELEELGLEMHRLAGFEVPRSWQVKIGDLDALAVERFDRSGDGRVLFMESVYSLLASGARDITTHYSTDYDRIGSMLDNPRVEIVADRKQARLHLLERLLLAMLTGNGDLHLENLAVLERDGEAAFSPVYDPTPMRAYSIHDALIPQGMSFGGYGDFDERSGEPTGFEPALRRFANHLGFNSKRLGSSIERLLQVTEDYPQRVEALQRLPGEHKQRLCDVHAGVRHKLEACLP